VVQKLNKMTNYTIENIALIINGKLLLKSNGHDKIAHLLFDTRKIIFAETSLFFALKSNKNNGHKYLNDAYEAGIRNFIVSESTDISKIPILFWLKTLKLLYKNLVLITEIYSIFLLLELRAVMEKQL
jgi:UDP-N-acetylmuramyl pentapeptide synthase